LNFSLNTNALSGNILFGNLSSFGDKFSFSSTKQKKKNPQTKKSDEFLSPDYLMFYLIGEVFTMPMVCLLIMWV
jgi:hypothetical protein